jgi:hypothetical protein
VRLHFLYHGNADERIEPHALVVIERETGSVIVILMVLRMDLLSFELKDKSNLRVIFKVDGEEYEGMKDRISKWTEVSNLRFRKNKKTEGLGVRSERMICSPLKKIVSL